MLHYDMRLNRRLRITLALLLAWMLPQQGAVAMPDCAQFESAAPQHEHCVHGAAAIHQHGCSTHCCAAAIAYAHILWAAPRSAAADIAVAVLCPSPTVELDRLDRPPRSI
jgi:hypothetical protein